MPVCSICTATYDDCDGVYAHERRKHRDAFLANKQPWELYYKAPAADLPYCALCEIYIGHEATFSHLSNPGHLANVALSSSTGRRPPGSQAETRSTPVDDFWETAVVSRRPRARLAASEEDEVSRADVDLQQVHTSQSATLLFHILTRFCLRARRMRTMLMAVPSTKTCTKTCTKGGHIRGPIG